MKIKSLFKRRHPDNYFKGLTIETEEEDLEITTDDNEYLVTFVASCAVGQIGGPNAPEGSEERLVHWVDAFDSEGEPVDLPWMESFLSDYLGGPVIIES